MVDALSRVDVNASKKVAGEKKEEEGRLRLNRLAKGGRMNSLKQMTKPAGTRVKRKEKLRADWRAGPEKKGVIQGRFPARVASSGGARFSGPAPGLPSLWAASWAARASRGGRSWHLTLNTIIAVLLCLNLALILLTMYTPAIAIMS